MKFLSAFVLILSALPALAQNKPVTVKMPTLAAPVFRIPKPTVVQMPKPPAYTKRFPIIKPVHFPPTRYSR
jgi:hypothetical protein